jgi:hypothetical protein
VVVARSAFGADVLRHNPRRDEACHDGPRSGVPRGDGAGHNPAVRG